MIAPGTRLGPYEVTAQLGAGGMGEVYRARDSRLDRIVAIKVLPSRFSSDPRLRERFEREARAISALSHPHICTLYDIGNHAGVEFLVMEYLDGESLADRLARGPLPIEQVVRYGFEIAQALEKAHRQGIVHRDLKPGNIILTKSGAKLLDFGLAKFSLPVLHVHADQDAPTALVADHQKPLTEDGMIVGTFQYMAPEQLEGLDADKRADIFALGAVLYEMATGKRAFEGKSRVSVIASILERDPAPMSSVVPLAPRALERIVQICLAKDPDERWQSAHDVAVELRWLRDASGDTLGPQTKQRSRRAHLKMAGIVLLAALAGAAATWLVTRGRQSPQPVAHVAIPLPPEAPLDVQDAIIAISPDGSHIAYAARYSSSRRRLYVRAIHEANAKAVAGTEGIYDFTFSPDGRSIAFTSGALGRSTLRRLSLDGGSPVTLIRTLPSTNGLAWHGDTIYFGRNFVDGLWSVSASGGQPRQIAKIDTAKKIRALLWPEMLPGGKTLLATAWTGASWDDAMIVAISVADGNVSTIIEGGSYPQYLSSGHLLFGRGGSILIAPFDADSLRVTATPQAVLAGVSYGAANGDVHYAVSDNGHLLHAPGGLIEPKRMLVLLDRDGNETPLVQTRRPYRDPAMSPDGRLIAASVDAATVDVWLLDIERDLMTRLTFGGEDTGAVFSPDGQYVIWNSSRGGASNIYRVPVDGSGREERLTTSKFEQRTPAPTPDGKFIAYSELTANGDRDLWLLPLDTRKPRTIVATPFDESVPAFSPDGQWISYTSNESGKSEVYIRAFPTSGGKQQISIDGGRAAVWSRDGREIYYRSGTKLYAVPIETTPRFRAGRPRLVFDRNVYVSGFDVAPDGRLLVVKENERVQAPQLSLILNWASGLRRK